MTRSTDPAGSQSSTARTGGLLFISGAVMTVAGIVLPHSPQATIPGFVGIAVLAALVGGLLLAFGGRFGIVALQAAMLIGSVLIALSLVFNGEKHGGAAAGNEVLFLWVALYAGYYFRRPSLIVQLAAIGCLDALALLVINPGHVGYTRWLITTGGAVLAGIVVYRLRVRNDDLFARLVQTGRTDQLTGLLNRRGFDEELEHALARSARSQRPVSLVLGDLDHFKQLNDTLGHLAGDEALETVGRVVRELARRGDAAARLGGDEFAVVLNDTNALAALTFAERIRTGVAEPALGERPPLTMSFGIASYPDRCQTATELTRAADIALYAAKHAGGNQSLLSKLYINPNHPTTASPATTP